MNDLETPLPARYPKIAVFTLWIGAFGAAALVSMFDALMIEQNFTAAIIRKTLLLGLLGIGAGIALTAIFVRMRVNRLSSMSLIATALIVVAFYLSRIAMSLSRGPELDFIIGLLAVSCSMAAYTALFIITALWSKATVK